MKDHLIQDLETFLRQEDFGTNWDGAYQDVIPTIQRFFATKGFETRLLNEADSPSGDTELVASKDSITVRVPWAEDRNGCSVVHLHSIQIARSASNPT